MRIILFTGKGGVGKTTVAASTALRAARSGLRTLVMSTDPAHSLADALDVELGPSPTLVEERLYGQQIDAQRRLEEGWREIQEYVLALFDWGGVDAIAAEELSVIPGLDEVFALTDVRRASDSGDYDLLVVDCAPTAETLRLLSLPEALNWYIERIFPVERRIVKTIRPLLTRVTSMPIADDGIFRAVERLHGQLIGVHELLNDTNRSSVRLVVNAEKMVIAEARRTFTYLSLFGYRVDAVICNRILPEEVTDPYFEGWKKIQAEHLNTIEDAFQPVPILRVPLFDREMIGVDSLNELGAELYSDHDPAAMLFDSDPLTISKVTEGYELRVSLPFTEKSDLDLLRKGDDLYIKVGSHKRSLALPSVLQRLTVAGAHMEQDRLVVQFRQT
ncbi:MAG: ArsA family ATPase [Actinomycetota bacterium]